MASSESSEVSIRITRTGKMTHWITYALKCLEEEEKRPIIVHTLPRYSKDPAGSNESLERPDPSKNASKIANSLITTPRLISVIEIIKREYLNSLDKKRSTRVIGLHQYNEIGSLEELSPVDSPAQATEEQRMEKIAMALEGKNFPQQRQSPYMKITLSVDELPQLVKKGATYQKPLRRTLSRAAKKRVKADQKKLAQENDEALKSVGADVES
ncbi:hypothetical protein D9757_006240 [Collybiopsis confluens]|uniref:Uncharacterized protein n=1 Tax=Collybiopsis confluens TaxID=2823264 RepID=A0A8H5HJV6_9AGAR|nr:hypothetical protein D9757_006240 [Collybiopsis confluens]